MFSKVILVTGGAGYIGSHVVVRLLEAGYDVVSVDNYSNSSPLVYGRIEKITGRKVSVVEGDVCCKKTLQEIFQAFKIDAVIHFAGLKAVGESVDKPLEYYDNNLKSTLSLLEVMREFDVPRFVFSSSATVYNDSNVVCYDEATTKTDRPSSPYGTTKLMQEWILEDTVRANTAKDETNFGLQIVSLRYFNPVGAHPSGEIGEDPKGIPNNLTPFITQVAVGRREYLSVFGDNYPTPDGTCIRDYIHVVDLANGHLAALEHLFGQEGRYFNVFNLGSGKGSSVYEVLHAFEDAVGKKIPYQVSPRRAGDLPEFYAKADKAKRDLGFVTSLTLQDMARDAWLWQSKNPMGYSSN